MEMILEKNKPTNQHKKREFRPGSTFCSISSQYLPLAVPPSQLNIFNSSFLQAGIRESTLVLQMQKSSCSFPRQWFLNCCHSQASAFNITSDQISNRDSSCPPLATAWTLSAGIRSVKQHCARQSQAAGFFYRLRALVKP